MKVCFELVEPMGSSRHESYKIFTKPFSVIGRNPDCDWVIDDDKKIVSGRHAEVLVHPEGCYIKDVSKNGIYLVNANQKIDKNKPFLLYDSLLIQIGRMRMRVKLLDQKELIFSMVPELKDPLFSLKEQNEPICYLDQHTFYIYHLALRGFFSKLDIKLEEVHQESLIALTDRCADLLKVSLGSVKVLLEESHNKNIKQNTFRELHESVMHEKIMCENMMGESIIDEPEDFSVRELSLNTSLKFSLPILEKKIKTAFEYHKKNMRIISEMSNVLLYILKPEEIQDRVKKELKNKNFFGFYRQLWDKYKELYEKSMRYFN